MDSTFYSKHLRSWKISWGLLFFYLGKLQCIYLFESNKIYLSYLSMNEEQNELREFIRKLPKTELHLHIEGTLEPELSLKLAQRNKIDIPQKTIEEIKALYKFTCLQDFLIVYYQACSVLITEEDFFELGWEYFLKAKADGVVHSEIFFDPQTHTQRGIPFETVINGLVRAQKKAEEELGLTSYLIMCFLRDLSEEEAFKTLD